MGYTYSDLVAIAERNGANCADIAIGRMMDIVEEETGAWPKWDDVAADWVVELMIGGRKHD